MTPQFETSPLLLPFRHGFFARTGGWSEGDYSSLNCGQRSDDDPGRVRRNRETVALTLGAAPGNLFTGYQIHSADVAVLEHRLPAGRIKADALVTKIPSAAIGVLTADCQPVLLADPDSGVVGAAHAGWRGALAGLLENTVDAMAAQGAARSRIRAVIGPAISQENYEVGPEFKDRFLRTDPESRRFFRRDSQGRLVFDLPGYGLMRLGRAGIQDAEWTGNCTYADSARYFSYRRSRHENREATGLLISVIVA